ncbi:MinD/ParA family protein [Caldinitratiruptor microaerophilus]|uniref:Site-determining protein n=1 Tax=Caldinitratiruptor microaerophilus TaxID=671077 RepID=A0AA35CI43_9FIRM|nr:MinD/ParA family protein [Caldinitratiruptor microaerophilus]BDG59372.1 site-determining protein [Caldinitratiruptor microaerophilus]
MADQAQALRDSRFGSESLRPAEVAVPRPAGAGDGPSPRTLPARRARVLAVTSGKGGVGKTNVTVNLAYALIRLGHEVVVLDGDLGLANVDVVLGTTPQYHLGHVLSGERTVQEVIYPAPAGLYLVAGGSGLSELADLPEETMSAFIQGLRALESEADFLLVDTGAGMGRSVLSFVLAADEVIVVTTPEPPAITDAYALVKAIVRRRPAARLSLIVNQAHGYAEAREAADRLSLAVLRFLGAHIELLGVIPHDPQVYFSVRNQTPFLLAAPHSPAAQAMQAIARRLLGTEDVPEVPRVGLFFDRLLKMLVRRAEG